MNADPHTGRHAMSGTFASIVSRLEPRSQHPVIQAGEADAQKVLRHSFTSRPATQEEAEANRLEERIAGFDSSPWGVS